MTDCHDEGQLRAYLDAELAAEQHAALAAHLALCATCRARLADTRSSMARVQRLLGTPAVTPDPQAALARLQRQRPTIDAQPSAAPHQTGYRPAKQPGRTTAMTNKRTMIAGIAAAVLALSLLALPPVRAAADQLLQIFRVRNVVFVPVSQERIAELEALDLDKTSLFVSEPKLVAGDAETSEVADTAAATRAAGFPVAQPSALPSAPLTTTLSVAGARSFTFQVDIEAARSLLKATGVDDVSLPDALGAQPITADLLPSVTSSYEGSDYRLRLTQGRSPQVNLPDGVELSVLGKAALRVLGLTSIQAEELSSKIDWNSTLLFPIPADVSNVRQVKVGNADGMLVGAGKRNDQHFMLYWQRGEQFFVLESNGLDATNVVAAAASLR